MYSLQHYMLFIFRKILVLSPSLLTVFRSEGVWDFIFSEHFYFGSSSTVIPEAYINYTDVRPWSNEPYTRSKSFNQQVPSNEADILQTNVISVIEFAATLDVTSHNMVSAFFFPFDSFVSYEGSTMRCQFLSYI